MSGIASSEPVTYQTEDFVVFASQIRQGRMRLYRRIALGLVGIALLTLLLDGLMHRDMPWWQDALALLAALMLWALASPAVQGRMIWQSTRRSKELRAPHSFAVTEEGLGIQAGEGRSVLKWSAISQLSVEAERLFVFASAASAYIVPRRAFAAPAEFEAFIEAARSEWKRHHRL